MARCGPCAAAGLLLAGCSLLAACSLYLPEPQIELTRQRLTALLDSLALERGSSVLVGAGDIARCDALEAAAATARIVAAVVDAAGEARVFTTGDHAYEAGTRGEFARCYAPSWGRFESLTRPTPGNHDYETAHAEPYFDYFGYFDRHPEVRARGGYFSFELAGWHVVGLNSLLPIESGSEQLAWLERDLREAGALCTIAYWHHPLFSSGYHGAVPWDRGRDTADVWRVLSSFGAEIVVNGHEHLYERFAPQSPDGEAADGGPRQFTVGTGGGRLQPVVIRRPNSERVHTGGYGVLVLRLAPDSYRWAFLGADGVIHDRSNGPVPCRP